MKNVKIQTKDIPKLVDTINTPNLHKEQEILSMTIKVAYEKQKSILTITYKNKEKRERQIPYVKTIPFLITQHYLHLPNPCPETSTLKRFQSYYLQEVVRLPPTETAQILGINPATARSYKSRFLADGRKKQQLIHQLHHEQKIIELLTNDIDLETILKLQKEASLSVEEVVALQNFYQIRYSYTRRGKKKSSLVSTQYLHKYASFYLVAIQYAPDRLYIIGKNIKEP